MPDSLPSAVIYNHDLETAAGRCMRAAADSGLRIATAESCTGGALAALLTDIEGVSHAFERGFAVYCDEAKTECLDVAPEMLREHGAVSAEVAIALARGTLGRSAADIAVAITGYAGPAGDGGEEGLVHICVASREGGATTHDYHFGKAGRTGVRQLALKEALGLLMETLEHPSSGAALETPAVEA